MRWVTEPPDEARQLNQRQPSEAALDEVRRGDEPLPTHELHFTSLFTPARNRPLTQEEKRRG